jgi:hypothetical protein
MIWHTRTNEPLLPRSVQFLLAAFVREGDMPHAKPSCFGVRIACAAERQEANITVAALASSLRGAREFRTP